MLRFVSQSKMPRKYGKKKGYRRGRGSKLVRRGNYKPTAQLKKFILNTVRSYQSPEEFKATHVKLWNKLRGYAKWFPMEQAAELLAQVQSPWAEYMTLFGESEDENEGAYAEDEYSEDSDDDEPGAPGGFVTPQRPAKRAKVIGASA